MFGLLFTKVSIGGLGTTTHLKVNFIYNFVKNFC